MGGEGEEREATADCDHTETLHCSALPPTLEYLYTALGENVKFIIATILESERVLSFPIKAKKKKQKSSCAYIL